MYIAVSSYFHVMTFLRQPRLLLLATSTMPVSNCWSKLFEPVRFFKHHLPIFWSNSSVVAVGKTTSPLAWDSRVGTPSFRPLIWCEMLVKSASNARLVAGAGRESVGVLATVTSTWGRELQVQEGPAEVSQSQSFIRITVTPNTDDCFHFSFHPSILTFGICL